MKATFYFKKKKSANQISGGPSEPLQGKHPTWSYQLGDFFHLTEGTGTDVMDGAGEGIEHVMNAGLEHLVKDRPSGMGVPGCEGLVRTCTFNCTQKQTHRQCKRLRTEVICMQRFL